MLFYSCEKEDDFVIDPTVSAPLLHSVVLSEDTVFTVSSNPIINLNVTVIANANDGAPVYPPICQVSDPSGTIRQFTMSGGTPSNTNPGDQLYSATINITNIQCLLVGRYDLEFVVENFSGLFSNILTSSFIVVNTANQPPVITSTNLPDSVVRPQPGDSTLLTITINVNDPDGLCDLRDVTFVTTRPNGVILPPIPMAYTGNGLFAFSNYVSYSADPSSYGYFKYEFTARDRSNLSGAPVKDSIKFVQPTNP